MRKILSLFMTLCVSLTLFAYDTYDGGIYYNLDYYSSTAEVTYRSFSYDENYDTYSGDVNIPASVWYNGTEYRVTRIGDYAFQNCHNITTVTVPESVTGIGEYAFYSSSISSITIPESIVSIGTRAFCYCTNISSIVLPNSITEIKSGTFEGCYNLTSIVIPESITSIEGYAFYNCEHLTSITIPKNVRSIGLNAFASCRNLSVIVVEDSNTVYDSRNNCNAIIETATNTLIAGCQNTIIPNSVICIGESSFSVCYNLSSIAIPNSVDSIGNNVFSGISPLLVYCTREIPMHIGTNVLNREDAYFVVPNTTTYKNAWSVEYKDKIISHEDAYTEVTLVANAGNSALHQALGLEKLNSIVGLKINGTINSYDIMMIRNQMPKLLELDLSDASIVANDYEYAKGYSSKNDTLTAYSFTGTGTKLVKVTLPKTLKYITPNAFNSKLRDLTICSGSIAQNAFYQCSNIRKLSLLEGVNAIGGNAFYSCSFTSLIIPNTVSEIGNSAFASCSALYSVVIGKNVAHIGNSAFSNCSTLQSVIMDQNVIHIGNSAFAGCSMLHSINLPKSLTSIGKSAFQNAGLTEVVIPANVTTIGDYAFAGKEEANWYSGTYYHYYRNATTNNTDYYTFDKGSLQSLTIPADSKLTTISAYTFAGNNNLKSISILGDSIRTIENGAFLGCQLDTLILPPHLTALSTLSFGYCTGLKFVAMPNTLTEVASNAFVGCTNLDNIQFPKKLTKIGHHAFADCTNLRNVDIPGLVTDIEEYAFKNCNVKSIYSYLFDPFTIGQNTFSPYANANAILYIPNLEDTEMKYLYDTQWSQFLNRYRMDKSFVYDDFYGTGDINIKCDDDPLKGNPNATLYPGAGLTIEDNDCDTTGLGNIIIGSDGDDAWGAVLAGCNLHIDSLIQNITIMGKKWYFFGFPFEIRIEDIHSDAKYVIYEYDGQMRARRDTTGWKRLPKEQKTLYPGHGYIFQFNFAGSGEISIMVPSPRFCEMLEKILLRFFPSDKDNNKSWNYASNPFLGYYDINDLNITTPITIWDVAQGNYRTVRPGDDDYYFSPYEGFFLQNIEEHDFELIFDRNKAMTKRQMDEQRINKRNAPARKVQSAPGRSIINLTIASETATDDTRIVINEQAGMGYELGKDAAKFLSSENSVPQIFSYDDNSVQYAINERPMETGIVELGVRIPASGIYTIDATRMDTAFYLLDRKQNTMHDFSNGAYMFSSGAGIQSNRFALVRQNNAPTSTEEENANTMIDVTHDGIYIHGNANLQVYNMAGIIVADGNYSGLLPLPTGVYMVVSDGNTTKCVIR